jgi:hypothetical protein
MHHSDTILLTLVTILPACSFQQVSYKQDVSPILYRNCNGCHTAPDGYGYRETGLAMDTYDAVIKGTIYGSIIVEGDSRRSILNKMVEGRVGMKRQLTHGDNQGISDEEIETLKVWVDQGALNN